MKPFSASALEKYFLRFGIGTFSFKNTNVLSSIGSAVGLENRHGPSCASIGSDASTSGRCRARAKQRSPFARPLRTGNLEISAAEPLPGRGVSSSSASEVMGDPSSKLLLLEVAVEEEPALDNPVPNFENLLVKEERAPPPVKHCQLRLSTIGLKTSVLFSGRSALLTRSACFCL